MRITDVKILRIWGQSKAYPPMHRSRTSRAVDKYPEFDADDYPAEAAAQPSKRISMDFIKIETDSGIYGFYNISPYPAVGFIVTTMIRPLILGRDPEDIETIWDILSTYERHARGGMYMMAVSMVDICLWDIKAKAAGLPLYRLLGGTRKEITAYGSMLGHSIVPEHAAQKALEKKNEGLTAQKWFFRWGPVHGKEGMEKNLRLVAQVREAVGEGYKLMFDAWMAWDAEYAAEMARMIEPYGVHWLEEPLRPRDFDGYKELKSKINIPLAAGEHIYTRWEAKRWLDEGVLSFVQADPDWTGGISETIQIAKVCEKYDVPLIPHGHSVYGATAVVGSMPEKLCPMAEVLLLVMEQRQVFYKEGRMPVNGMIDMPDTPGAGVDIDESKIEEIKEIFTEYKS